VAVEDPRTYDKTDEFTVFTVDATTVSYVDLDRDMQARVCDSKGAGHFSGDFTHQFECKYFNEATLAIAYFWELGDSDTDVGTQIANNENTVGLAYYDDTLILRVREAGVSVDFDKYLTPTTNTAYFVTIVRTDATDTYVVTIRTGSHLGVEQDELIITANNPLDFEWVFFVNSHDDGKNNDVDGYTKDFDLNEVAVTLPQYMHHYQQQS